MLSRRPTQRWRRRACGTFELVPRPLHPPQRGIAAVPAGAFAPPLCYSRGSSPPSPHPPPAYPQTHAPPTPSLSPFFFSFPGGHRQHAAAGQGGAWRRAWSARLSGLSPPLSLAPSEGERRRPPPRILACSIPLPSPQVKVSEAGEARGRTRAAYVARPAEQPGLLDARRVRPVLGIPRAATVGQPQEI